MHLAIKRLLLITLSFSFILPTVAYAQWEQITPPTEMQDRKSVV